MLRNNRGFTLLETLIALAIYTIVISTLVVVNRGGLDTLNDLESRALARRALANIIADFRYSNQTNQNNIQIGRHTGEYKKSHFNYQWQIQVERSQQYQTYLLEATIKSSQNNDVLAKQREVW